MGFFAPVFISEFLSCDCAPLEVSDIAVARWEVWVLLILRRRGWGLPARMAEAQTQKSRSISNRKYNHVYVY